MQIAASCISFTLCTAEGGAIRTTEWALKMLSWNASAAGCTCSSRICQVKWHAAHHNPDGMQVDMHPTSDTCIALAPPTAIHGHHPKHQPVAIR